MNLKELQIKQEKTIKELKDLEVLKKKTVSQISYRKKVLKDIKNQIEILGGGQLSMF